MAVSLMNEISIGAIREAYGRVAYSHKTQEKAKDINECCSSLVKWINVLLVSCTTASATYSFFMSPQQVNAITAILSVASLLFLIAQLSFNPEARVQAHKNCADKLWFVREKYANLLSDMMSDSIDAQSAMKIRDEVTQELSKIYAEAPCAGGLAYFFAQRALKIDKELTFTEKELNQLLPPALRAKI